MKDCEMCGAWWQTADHSRDRVLYSVSVDGKEHYLCHKCLQDTFLTDFVDYDPVKESAQNFAIIVTEEERL